MKDVHGEVAELARAGTPRRVRFREKGMKRTWILIALGMLVFPHNLIGVGMLGMAMNQVALAVAGTEVVGHVKQRLETQSKGRTFRYVTIAYTFEGSESVTPEKPVDETRWSRLSAGSRVSLRCSNLFGVEGAELLGEDGSVPRSTFGIVVAAVFWNGALAVFWYMLLLRSLFAAWLVGNGTPRVGRAVAFDVRNPRATMGTFRYAFTGTDGREHRGSMFAKRDACDPFPPGTELVVFQHPWWPWSSYPAALAPVVAVLPPADGGTQPVAVR